MPPLATYLLGAVQMTSTGDRARNLATAIRLLNEAADLGVIGAASNDGRSQRDLSAVADHLRDAARAEEGRPA